MRVESRYARHLLTCLILTLVATACSGGDKNRKGSSGDGGDAALLGGPAHADRGDADRGPDASVDGAADSAAPVAGPGALVAEPEDDAAFLWGQTQVRTFEIGIEPSDLDQLNADPTAEQYVAGTFIFGDETYPNIGVRYKASYGGWVTCFDGSWGTGGTYLPSGSKQCPKLSMKVSFDWQDPAGRFHGLKKLNFASMNDDNSQMRERLGYALFREYDLAAPRSMHARLVINGRLEGLFLAVEEVDGRFTRSRFTEGGKGNIYKEIWPKWTDPSDYEPSLRSNRNDPDLVIERVARFAQALESAAGDAEVAALSDQWMDNNYIMRYVAADRTILNDDGIFHWYCTKTFVPGNNPGDCSNHNFFWYEEQGWDRLWLIVWDLPLALKGGSAFIRIIDQWNDTGASCEQKSNGALLSPPQFAPACDKLVHGWASLDDQYKSAVRAFLDGPFSEAEVDAKLDAWSAQIAAAVDEAEAAGQGPRAADWRQELADLRVDIADLRAAAEARTR